MDSGSLQVVLSPLEFGTFRLGQCPQQQVYDFLFRSFKMLIEIKAYESFVRSTSCPTDVDIGLGIDRCYSTISFSFF